MLLFKKKFLEAIRNGEKTQTIRLWDRCRMKAGQRSYIPGIGYISILSVEPVEIDHLTDADAVPDGFPNAASLRTELHSIYDKEIEKGFRAFRIRFFVFSEEDQRKMQREKELREKKNSRKHRQLDDLKKKEQVDQTLEKLKNLAQNGKDKKNPGGSGTGRTQNS